MISIGRIWHRNFAKVTKQVFDFASRVRQHLGMINLGEIPGTGRSAFSLSAPDSPPIPVLIAVPHAGRDSPSAILDQMRDADFATLKLEDRFVDVIGKQLAKRTGASLITAHAPRAMLDLNRAHDDVDWDMITGPKPHPVRHSQANRRARSGLGLIPRRLPGLGEIWRNPIGRSELQSRIDLIHRPYHKALSGELARIRDQWGGALLVDLHSMPPLRISSHGEPAAKFVLGDRFGTSCHHAIVNHGYQYLENKGKQVAHNRPYAGGFVLDTHGEPIRGIHAVQMEICRSCYLDGDLREITAHARPLARLLAELVAELGQVTARLVDPGCVAEAAE